MAPDADVTPGAGFVEWPVQPSGCRAMPNEGIQGDEWSAYVTLGRTTRTMSMVSRWWTRFPSRPTPAFSASLGETIDADLKVRAHLQRERFCSPPLTRLHYCQRGRSPSLCPNTSPADSSTLIPQCRKRLFVFARFTQPGDHR